MTPPRRRPSARPTSSTCPAASRRTCRRSSTGARSGGRWSGPRARRVAGRLLGRGDGPGRPRVRLPTPRAARSRCAGTSASAARRASRSCRTTTRGRSRCPRSSRSRRRAARSCWGSTRRPRSSAGAAGGRSTGRRASPSGEVATASDTVPGRASGSDQSDRPVPGTTNAPVAARPGRPAGWSWLSRGRSPASRGRRRGRRDTRRRCRRKSQLSPNDVTPATTFVSPRKFGPPESPKQVPPVWALLDSTSEPSPVKPVLIWISCGWATIRTRWATSFHAAASGKAFCRPYPTDVKVVLRRGLSESSWFRDGSAPYSAHDDRVIEHDDAQVEQEERVRVVLRMRVRRAADVAGVRVAVGRDAALTSASNQISTCSAGPRCSGRRSGRPSTR